MGYLINEEKIFKQKMNLTLLILLLLDSSFLSMKGECPKKYILAVKIQKGNKNMKMKNKIILGFLCSSMLLCGFSSITPKSHRNRQVRNKVLTQTQVVKKEVYSDDMFVIDGQNKYFSYSENTYAYLIEWVSHSFDIIKEYHLHSKSTLEESINEMNAYEDIIPEEWSSGESKRYWLVTEDGKITQNMIDEICPPGTPGVGYEAEGWINLEELGYVMYPNPLAFSLVEVADTIDPSISINGQTNIYISNVDNPVTSDAVKALLTAIDETDGNITDSIRIKYNSYLGNEKKLGTYPIVFEVCDAAGNTAETTINVVVKDITDPTITGKTSYSLKQTETLTLDTIKEGLTIKDNYDTLSINDLVLVKDNYTINKDKVGSYIVTYKVSDSSTNSTEINIIVNVTDGIAPVISGPESVTTNLSLSAPIENLISSYTALDAEDGNVKVNIHNDGYSSNKNKTGSYKVILSAIDKAGNVSTKEITIVVKDNIPPVFTAEEIITIDYYNSLTHEQIVSLLTDREIYSFSIIKDEYSGNEKKAGKYKVVYLLKFENGTEETFTRLINVVNNDPWYITIWNSISNFFISTFSPIFSWININVFVPVINFFRNLF